MTSRAGALIVLLALALGACRPAPPPPNVLMLISDTLRADALSCYGGPAYTPNLCSLGERGVLFERAYANSSWTLPSSVALFTGRYPGEFVRDADRELAQTGLYHVDDAETLLVERLRASGYDAPLFLGTGLARESNALQGFSLQQVERDESDLEAFRVAEPRVVLQDTGYRHRRLLGALEYLLDAGGSPFFLLQWIHDPHAEYSPPSSHRHLAGWTGRLPRKIDFYMGLGHRDEPGTGRRKLRDHVDSLTPLEIEALKHLYQREVESVDERIGTLLTALELAGLHERTFVVFTSDHGEGFGEHGRYLHGNSFYDELVHVPLIIAGPGIEGGRRVRTPVSHVDLVPTLSELLGVETASVLRGRSLAPTLYGGDDPAPDRAHYLTSPMRLGDADALVAAGYKLIASRDGGVELYDLAADPGERRSLAAKRPADTARLLARLSELREQTREARSRLAAGDARDIEELDRAARETEDQLRALGYLE